MKDIVDVNNDISWSLHDIQFLRPSGGKQNMRQVLLEFLNDEALSSPEAADEMGQYVDYDLTSPELVVDAVSSLQMENRVSAADIAVYKADLEKVKLENEHLQKVLSMAAENERDLDVKKSRLEEDFLEQVIALLSQLSTEAPVRGEDPIVPTLLQVSDRLRHNVRSCHPCGDWHQL